MQPVLVLGADHRIAVTIARCLSQHGVPVDAASPPGWLCESRAIRQNLWMSTLEDSRQVAKDLLQWIDQHGYDLILPTNDAALASLHDQYQLLTTKVRLGCPPPEILSRVLD